MWEVKLDLKEKNLSFFSNHLNIQFYKMDFTGSFCRLLENHYNNKYV